MTSSRVEPSRVEPRSSQPGWLAMIFILQSSMQEYRFSRLHQKHIVTRTWSFCFSFCFRKPFPSLSMSIYETLSGLLNHLKDTCNSSITLGFQSSSAFTILKYHQSSYFLLYSLNIVLRLISNWNIKPLHFILIIHFR